MARHVAHPAPVRTGAPRPVALVTGASVGIGREFARELAASGCDMVLVARTADRLEEVAAELRSRFDCHVEVLAADLADRADVERVADRLRDPERPVDVLVNNAGFGLGRATLDTDVADQERMVDVMVKAVLVLTLAAVGPMTQRGRGAVINVSSIAGWVPAGTYGAAKAWVLSFTESLAGELSGTGVVATAVCPGFTRTEFHERAALDMEFLPEVAWLDAEKVVRTALADVRRRRTVSTPGLVYKGLRAVVGVAPRPLVRAVTTRLNAEHPM